MPPLNGAQRIRNMATKTVAPARKKPRASAPAKKPAAKTKADVAQPAEHLPSKQGVAGSSPAGRSKSRALEPEQKPAPPANPSDIQQPPAPSKPLTPARRWEAWLQAVGDDGAMEHLAAFIADGGHLADYCRHQFLPYKSVRVWIGASDARKTLYAGAREDRADTLADEIVAIADEAEVCTRVDGEGVTLALDSTAVARNKLRVDARKWVAAKLKPRVYGEKMEVTGGIDLRTVPDDQLRERAEALLAVMTGATTTVKATAQ